MPRAMSENNLEDTMDDTEFEDWEEVEGLGEKVIWSIGTTLVGRFKGIRKVPVDDKQDGFSNVDAVQMETRDGKRVWFWLPFNLKLIFNPNDTTQAIKPNQEIYIKCTGEEKLNDDPDMNPTKTFTFKRKPM